MEQHKDAEQRGKFKESRKKLNVEIKNLQKRIIKIIEPRNWRAKTHLEVKVGFEKNGKSQ
jgi:hypothetical protein